MLEIPHDPNLAAIPSWKENEGFVSIRCGNPACAKRATLRDGTNWPIRKDGTKGHEIAPDGTVTPSIVCPSCGEGWHVWGKLLGWGQIALLLCLMVPLSALEILGVDYTQSDKQGHFWLGAATSAVSMLALDRWRPDAAWYTRALVGTGAAAVVGAGKEWYDSGHLDRHTPDRKDFIATTTGGACVALSLCWKF